MPQSTGRDLHVDALLSQMAIGYFQDNGIAGLVAPSVPVEHQGDAYSIFSRADALRTEDTKRSPDTEANKVTRTISSDTYYCQNYALKYPVTIEDRDNADPVFRQNLINNGAEYVMDKLLLDWEVRLATLAQATASVGSSAGVASEWDAAASSDPIGDMETAMDNVQDLTGLRPNRIVMGLDAWRSLKRNDSVRDLIFGSTNAQRNVTRQQVAAALEVEQILVGAAYRNTANEAQAESLSKVWADHVTCYYAPQNPSRDRPSWMYSFRWNKPGLPNMQVERHPFNTRRKSEEVEVGYYQDEKITGSEYAYTLISVNSST
jgi:hypothetical protein